MQLTAATPITSTQGLSQGGFPGGAHGGPPGGGSMTLHNLVMFAHVIGVVGLFPALGIELFAVLRMRRVTSTVQISEWTLATKVTHFVHLISTPLILASGLYLLHLEFSEFGWTTGWLDVSLVTLLLLSSSGMWVSWQRMQSIGKMAATLPRGGVPGILVKRIQDRVLFTVTHVQVGIAVGILYLMLFQPEFVWSILSILLAGLAGLTVSRLTRREIHTPLFAARAG